MKHRVSKIRVWSSIIGRGYKTGERGGGASEVLPLQKRGKEKSVILSGVGGGGVRGAKSFGNTIFPFSPWRHLTPKSYHINN